MRTFDPAPLATTERTKTKGRPLATRSKRVETAYGAGWAEFSNAQDTNFKCRKNVSLWGCAVSAKPCTEFNLTQSNSTGEVESVRQAIQ